MDVKAFIFEATDTSLKIDAANNAVDTARQGVEAARAAVDAAKALVDTARLGVTAAKEEFEKYAERAEEFGLTRAKFKDAVERMKALLTDIGAIESVADNGDQPSGEPRQKASRKRKSDDTSETIVEQGSIQSDDSGVGGDGIGAVASASAEAVETFEVPPETDTPVDSVNVEAREGTDTTVEHVAGEIEDETAAATDVDATSSVTVDVETHGVALIEAPVNKEELPMADVSLQAPEETEGAADIGDAEATDVEEIDNSVAEQELLDFVDELGSTDHDVKVVLDAAIKVVAWRFTNITRQPIRVPPSPLTLEAVLALRDAPAEILKHHETALSQGEERLASAIAWFNTSVELLADAKPINDFRFSPAPKPPRARKPTEVINDEKSAAEAAAVAVSTETELSEVIDVTTDAPAVTETIEDMELFADGDAPENDETTPPTDVEITPQPEPEAKPATSPFAARTSRPSWLPG